MTISAKQKTLSFAITLVLIIVLHLFLFLVNIPTKDLMKIYEKLDESVWTEFIPKRIRFKAEETKPEEKIEKEREAEPPLKEPPKPVVTRKVFNPNVLKPPTIEKISPTVRPPEAQGTRSPIAGAVLEQPTRSPLNPTPFEFISGGTGDIVLPKQTGPAAYQGLKAGSGTQGAPSRPEFKPTGTGIITPTGPGSNLPDLSVQKFAPERLQVSEIYQLLIKWMKRNPAELSPVMKRFMGWQPAALSSKASFTRHRRNFELYFVCFESNKDLRIAIVERDSVAYLVDQGFTQESQQMKAGLLVRNPRTNQITRLSAELISLGDPRTKKFYGVFQSWWESVKHEVED